MRKLISLAVCLTLMLGIALPAFSQQMPQIPQLPVDKDVRIGKLPNGLTYYIRHNEKPKGQADFYIAQKVGSILEEDNQRGLAHFLEHMCFNGTTHYPGNALREWLESIGVKFGADLNAYTSVDQTVYNISNVPVASKGVQDSCLLILHDWANDLTLDPVEIDKERGVIHEEWRRSMVGQMRILEKVLPTMYPGSRYGYRLPIGTMEVVDNFPPQAIRDYYEAWYRPDQQGIIVVGDIDVDYIEGKIKEMFSDIEMPANAPERKYFPVEDNKGTIYAIGSDPEQKTGLADLMFKTDALPDQFKNTQLYYQMDYITTMIVTMLNQRLDDLSQKPDAPFAGAGASYGEFFLAKTKDAFEITAVAKGNDVRPALEAAYRELLRAARGGFTPSEYERARNEYVSRIEKKYNKREVRESSEYVNDYVNNFIDGDPIPGIEMEYQIVQTLAPAVPLEIINQTLRQLVTDDNRVLLVLTPEKEGFHTPTEAELIEVLTKVDAENIEPYKEEVKSEPLIPALPTPGKIVSEKHNDQWNATEFVLSNGVKVIVKPTDFQKDEIIFDATAKGGLVSIPEEKAASMIFLPYALRGAGLGDYTNSDLTKYLYGKQVSVNMQFDSYIRSVEGNSTVKDLQTLFELIYMNFTAKSLTEDEFTALQKNYAGILHNQEKDPQYIFSKLLLESSFKSPAKRALSTEIIEAAKREDILDITAQMTADAADYMFTFVGDIDLEKIRPLLEQYIATLPAPADKSLAKFEFNPGFSMIPGKTNSEFTTEMQTPQTWAFICTFGKIPFTAKDRNISFIAGQILGNRFLDKVREEMGATYSIGASAALNRIADPNAMIQTAFPMKPEMKQQVLDYIHNEFVEIQGNIKEEEVNKQKEYLVKNAVEDLEKNRAWVNGIAGASLNGVDTFNGAVETINSITVKDVEDYIKKLLAQGNYRVFTLDPKE